jgi:hypothetical protein
MCSELLRADTSLISTDDDLVVDICYSHDVVYIHPMSQVVRGVKLSGALMSEVQLSHVAWTVNNKCTNLK